MRHMHPQRRRDVHGENESKLKGLKAGLAALRTIGVLDELRGTEMRATGAMRHRFRRRALHTWLDFAGSRRAFLRR